MLEAQQLLKDPAPPSNRGRGDDYTHPMYWIPAKEQGYLSSLGWEMPL